MPQKSTDATLVAALRILSQDIQSEDGVANAAIAEAADRLESLSQLLGENREADLTERPQWSVCGELYWRLRRLLPDGKLTMRTLPDNLNPPGIFVIDWLRGGQQPPLEYAASLKQIGKIVSVESFAETILDRWLI